MRFSLIVPIYNVEKYVRKCVDSILAQTFTDFEALLVDDGGKDNCPQICDEYAKKDPRVRVIHKPNGGLISARNAGVLAAKGDYVLYVDGDDWTKPNMLAFVEEKLKESPVPLDMVMFAADEVYTDHLEETVNNVPEGLYDRARLEKEIFPYLLSDRREGFRGGQMILAHTWNKACRRELQQKYYCREERIRMFTDVPLTYECLLHCQNVYICNEHLYEYNKTNEQSIRAVGRNFYLTKSFYYLVTYVREHMSDLDPTMPQQLNDYPASLIIRSAMADLEEGKTLAQTAKHIRQGLEDSNLLSLISRKDLPRNPRLLILLLQLHLDVPAMMLCSAKVKQGGK